MNFQELRRHKQEICEIGKRIWQKGFCAGNEGNHSVKISDDRYLCTPTGLSKGFLEPEDIITVDGQGKQVEPNARGRRPTSEIKVHLAIYKHRPDVNAVIHSHPPHATAFAIAGIPLPEGIHPEAEVFLGKVKTAQYATPSTWELPNSLLPLIDQHTNTLLMGNHGSVSFDKDLTGAYYKLEILDAYCRILLLVKQLGKVNVLNQQQMTELLKVKEAFGIPDPRLSCSPQGCVGAENTPFLTQFDIRPQSAVADRDTGAVACGCNTGGKPGCGGACGCGCGGGGSENGKSEAVDEQTFEQMVQLITDQILASAA